MNSKGTLCLILLLICCKERHSSRSVLGADIIKESPSDSKKYPNTNLNPNEMSESPMESGNIQPLKCNAIVSGVEYSVESINNELLENKPLFYKIIRSLSDGCYSDLAKIIEYRVEKLNDPLALNVWEEMLRIRNDEILCDHSLHMFVKNTSLVAGYLVSSRNTLLIESIGDGLNFYRFNRKEYGYQNYDDQFDGKILMMWGEIPDLNDKYYLHSMDTRGTFLDVEKYLKDEIGSGRYSSLETQKLRQLLNSFEFARSKPFNETIGRFESGPESILIDKFGDFDGDGILDRLVITGATNEQSGEFRTEDQQPRKLHIYLGTDQDFELLLTSEHAIPPFYCGIIGSPETQLKNVQFSKNLFSFVYTNDTHFSYEYIFRRRDRSRGVFLDKIVVQYLTDVRGVDVAINKEITSKDFGERSLEKLNYPELNLLLYLDQH